MTRQTAVDQDTGPTPGVPGTWLAPVDPRSSCIHTDPGPRPITTYSSTKHTPVNPGSRPNPANQYQVGLCRPKHQACSLSDLGAKFASPKTPKPVQHQVTHPESLEGLMSEGLCLSRLVCKNWKRYLCPEMHEHQCKAIRIMKNQGNMTPPKN